MRRNLTALVTFLAVTGMALVAYAAGPRVEQEVGIDSFEFLGCSGDWTDQDFSPEIWRMGSSTGTTYLVRHPATCGANAGRDAKAKFHNGTLDLHYEPYSRDDVYALCECEFWAKFSFRTEPASVTSATFDARAARLKGAWPER